jgi:hypothetical protein
MFRTYRIRAEEQKQFTHPFMDKGPRDSVNWYLIHSVFSGLIGIYCVLCQLEKISENQRNGEFDYANRRNEVFDCADGCSKVQNNPNIQIDGRRKARTFHRIVWLVESIGGVKWIRMSDFWTNVVLITVPNTNNSTNMVVAGETSVEISRFSKVCGYKRFVSIFGETISSMECIVKFMTRYSKMRLKWGMVEMLSTHLVNVKNEGRIEVHGSIEDGISWNNLRFDN